MAIKETLLTEFDHEVGSTRRVLERLPDDWLTWKPHPKSRTFGELGTHLAGLPLWADIILNRASFDLVDAPARVERTSRADIVSALDAAAASARAALDKTDAEFEAVWTLKRQGHDVFSVPRLAAIRSFVLNHLIHHRGQLTVYLRLNDIPVPAIYGPSADEG